MNTVLSPNQISALQSVDLRMAWIHHGYTATQYHEGFPFANGLAIFGINANDYNTPAEMLADMGTGDVSAHERVMNEQWWGESPTNRDVVANVQSVLQQTPYVADSPLLDVSNYQDIMRGDALYNLDPDAIRNIPDLAEALEKSLRLSSELWVIDPFFYVDGLAAVRGIRRAVADSSNEKMRSGGAHDIEARNTDMAIALGDRAVELASDPAMSEGHRPKLAFTAGVGHRGVEEIMEAHQVSYASYVARRTVSERVFNVSTLLTSISPKRFARHGARRWFRNLRAHGYEPVNDKLGPMHLRDWQ